MKTRHTVLVILVTWLEDKMGKYRDEPLGEGPFELEKDFYDSIFMPLIVIKEVDFNWKVFCNVPLFRQCVKDIEQNYSDLGLDFKETARHKIYDRVEGVVTHVRLIYSIRDPDGVMK